MQRSPRVNDFKLQDEAEKNAKGGRTPGCARPSSALTYGQRPASRAVRMPAHAARPLLNNGRSSVVKRSAVARRGVLV